MSTESTIHQQLQDHPGVRVVAVSKQQSIAAIAQLHQLGYCDFGENYYQEAAAKITALQHLPLCWHFIGAIQANKAKKIAVMFDWVKALSSPNIADILNRAREQDTPLSVCLAVNISGDLHKSGLLQWDDIAALAAHVASLPKLKLRGLMAMSGADASMADIHQQFTAMQAYFIRLKQHYPDIDTLSMGMSQDWPIAIACGATEIRLGHALFENQRVSQH